MDACLALNIGTLKNSCSNDAEFKFVFTCTPLLSTLFWFVQVASYVYRWDTHAKSNSHSGIRYILNCLVCTERQSSYIHTYSYLDEFYVEQERCGNTSRIKLEICEWLSILPFLKDDGSTKHN